jgi:hypothetical protein
MPRKAKSFCNLVSVCFKARRRRVSYLATKEACQEDSEDGVENRSASETGDSLLPHRNVDIAISLYCKKVTVDAEYDGGTAELERIQRRRAKLQDSTADGHGCDPSTNRREREREK